MNTTRQDTDTVASPAPHTHAYRNTLVTSGLRLVYALAARIYKGIDRAVEFDALVSFGTIGLMQAAARYDDESAAKFTTFAYLRIRGAIIDGLRTLGPMSRAAWKRYKASRALTEEAGTLMEVKAVDDVFCRPTAISDVTVKQAKVVLREAVKRLPKRENYLINQCYYAGMPMGVAGRKLGLSKSWTSRLHGRALNSLRNELTPHSYATLAA